MKPGSKTRTRQTLGGATKTVTKSKGSTGAKTRVVERTKGNAQTGMETTRKIRRSDKSGVAKTKSTTFAGPSSRRADMDNVSTYQTKNTFRKKGSLKTEKRPLQKSQITVTRPTATVFERTPETVYTSRSSKDHETGKEFRKPGGTMHTKRNKPDRNAYRDKKGTVQKMKREVLDVDEVKNARKARMDRKPRPSIDKKSLHYRGAKSQKDRARDIAKENPNMGSRGVETGRTYTPSKSSNSARVRREYLKQFPKKK